MNHILQQWATLRKSQKTSSLVAAGKSPVSFDDFQSAGASMSKGFPHCRVRQPFSGRLVQVYGPVEFHSGQVYGKAMGQLWEDHGKSHGFYMILLHFVASD